MSTPEDEREADRLHEIWDEEDDAGEESDEPGEGSLGPPEAHQREIL